MRTSPAFGSGTSRSTTSNGPFARDTWTTRVFAIGNLRALRGSMRARRRYPPARIFGPASSIDVTRRLESRPGHCQDASMAPTSSRTFDVATHAARIEDDGYTVIPDFLDAADLAE